MNREIKFRVWDLEFKEMLYCPENMLSAKGRLYINYKIGSIKAFGDGKYVIQQYTGLKDKNGKEIYEGDIIFNADDNAYYDIRFVTGAFAVTRNGKYPTMLIDYTDDSYVVGNIFENPELLK